MIAALSKVAKAFNRPEYALRAQMAADFVLKNLFQKGRLLHRYRDGVAEIPGFLDDYAFLIWGLLELYEVFFSLICPQ